MNQIVIIGNGFDLAHGLKTSYSDFLLWYFNKSALAFSDKGNYEDNLLSIKPAFSRRFRAESPYNNLDAIFNYLNNEEHSFTYRSDFLKKIVDQKVRYNWVDIENEYYQEIVRQFSIIERSGISAQRIEAFKSNIKNLNESLEALGSFLVQYLSTITVGSNNKISEIESHFKELEREQSRAKGYILLINFNYTSVINLYFVQSKYNEIYKKIDIHGSIADESNPIIFGYGDEMESNFQKLENFNDNNILKHMKSISYLKTLNYSSMMRFLYSDDFIVHIMGHSCGLSDRLLLNRIFEHPNCKKINIFYHQRNEFENDYTNKTIEIFRHFKDKAVMQEKIVPFPNCRALVPIKAPALNSLSLVH